MSNNFDEQKHYQSLARYYTNISILLKSCKAVIHLEDKSDEIFWKPFFDRFLSGENFRFLPYSKSINKNDTSGCEQCLKYKNYLNKNFLICIDSDYRYIYQEPGLDIDHFIFQTYTYSLENHICYSEGLDGICKLSCNFDNTIYDFKVFFKKYSAIIYDLFIWHISLFKSNPNEFNKDEFGEIINMAGVDNDIVNQSKILLDELKKKVDSKITSLEALHPAFDLEAEKHKYAAIGINKDNVYLYIRGHNLFSLCSCLGKEICNRILEIEKGKLGGNSEQIKSLYNTRKYFDQEIFQNIIWNSYPEISKIETDMLKYKSF